MVNIHISSEAKNQFKSKNAIQRLKTFLKENLDTGLVTSSEYLKDGNNFEFKEDGDNIYVEVKEKEYVWGNNQSVTPQKPHLDARQKIRQRLKELRDLRTGKSHKEMRVMKKTVDRDILEKYVKIYRYAQDVPIPKPNEILDDPDKHKQMIEMLGSGLVGMTKNQTLNTLIADYFRTVANKVGFEVMDMEKIKQHLPPQQQKQQTIQENLPSNIDLSKYVDSDTESEDSDVEDVDTKEEDDTKEDDDDTKEEVNYDSKDIVV